MTDTEAREQLGSPELPVIPVLSEAWKSAWDDIRGPFNHPGHDNRCRSTLLQMHAVIHSTPELEKLGILYFKEHSQHMFVVPDKALIVLKTLDEDRRLSVNDTERAKGLYSQVPLQDFPQIPTLVAGLQPAQNWLAISGIFLFKPRTNGTDYSWILDISDSTQITSLEKDQSLFTHVIRDTDKTPKKTRYAPRYDSDKHKQKPKASGDRRAS